MEGNILVSGSGSGWLQYSGRPHHQDWAAAHGNPTQQHASRYTAPRGRCGSLPARFSLGAGWSDEPDNQFLGVRGSNVADEGVEKGVGRLGRVPHSEPLTYTADETLAYGSAIWHMNCTTGSLDALWTTADGTVIPMHFLGPSEVLVSGNPNILKERGFEGATQLKFSFVPNDVAFFDDI